MGLDMYLSRKIYIGAIYEHRKITGTIDLYENGKPLPIQLNQVSEITLRVGYWRKANAIHKWFVDNVQNGVDECQESCVTKEQLIELRNLCQQVLDQTTLENGMVCNGQNYSNGKWKDNLEPGQIVTNPEVAARLLPASEGFFFGSTEYNQWYIADIKETIEIIDAALKQAEQDGDKYQDFYYRASW